MYLLNILCDKVDNTCEALLQTEYEGYLKENTLVIV